MCTALSYGTAVHCFGRNLDLERSYGESVAITPRNFPFALRNGETMHRHHAMIGMAHVAAGYPLYYEATNEFGLSMAGLNFPESAFYHPWREGKSNIASFEVIGWLLGRCATLAEARTALQGLSVWHESFSPTLPASPLHWLVADKTGALTVESTADGLHIYENDTCVLTNEPPYPFHRTNLRRYAALTPEDPDTSPFSHSFGTFGLPGGLDSTSRFVRAAFTARHAADNDGRPADTVSRFFRILDVVAQTRGCAREVTRYSCCCTDAGVYYYATATNRSLTAVDLRAEDVEGATVVSYPLRTEQRVEMVN